MEDKAHAECVVESNTRSDSRVSEYGRDSAG
jgi:hypothetical protein